MSIHILCTYKYSTFELVKWENKMEMNIVKRRKNKTQHERKILCTYKY